MPKTLGLIAILLISFVILIGLARQIGWSLEAGKRLDASVDTISRLQKQNNDLKDKLVQAQSPDFIEELIRNKLNMSKPGETVVIISDSVINRVLGAQTPPVQVKIPNWRLWLKLFVH